MRERGRDLTRPLVVGLGVVVVAVVVWAAFLRPAAPPPIEASLPLATPGTPPAPVASSVPAPAELVAHAAGAVVNPGVHHLPAGARVDDLLAAAGGAAPDADLDRVNLAAPVNDGDRVWFPRVGEAVPPAVAAGSGVVGADAAAAEEPLDINAATAEELDALPGVGPTIAEAIVAHRERNGPFRSVDELVDVRGIGEARLADLRELVVVG
jgi:competence protein ComEA